MNPNTNIKSPLSGYKPIPSENWGTPPYDTTSSSAPSLTDTPVSYPPLEARSIREACLTSLETEAPRHVYNTCLNQIRKLSDPSIFDENTMTKMKLTIRSAPSMLYISTEEGNILMASIGDLSFLKAIIEIYKELLKENSQDASKLCDILRKKDAHGNTALSLAVQQNNGQAIQQLYNLYMILRNIYNSGSTVSQEFRVKYKELIDFHIQGPIDSQDPDRNTNCLGYAMLTEPEPTTSNGTHISITRSTLKLYHEALGPNVLVSALKGIKNVAMRFTSSIPHLVHFVIDGGYNLEIANAALDVCPLHTVGAKLQEPDRDNLFQYISTWPTYIPDHPLEEMDN